MKPQSPPPEVVTTPIDPLTTPIKPSTPPTKHLRRHSSGCAMLDQLLSDICNTLVTSEEQVSHTHLLMLPHPHII